jgi:hypothetical protein
MINRLKKIHFRTFVLLLLAALFISADEGYEERLKLKLKADYITNDELGNVFVVNDNQVTKYSADGIMLRTYSNLKLGDISFVDTHDPFKILLYYKDFTHVEFLDQTLSLTSSSIDLTRINLELATLACASYQGAFWVYDPMNFELVRVTAQLTLGERTGNLMQATGHAVDPNYMIERYNFFYLNDPAIGILIFDKYGTYFKTIPIKGLNSFQVSEKRIIYFLGDKISIYDTGLNEDNYTNLPWDGARSVSVCLGLEPQRLFMLGEEELYFYDIK